MKLTITELRDRAARFINRKDVRDIAIARDSAHMTHERAYALSTKAWWSAQLMRAPLTDAHALAQLILAHMPARESLLLATWAPNRIGTKYDVCHLYLAPEGFILIRTLIGRREKLDAGIAEALADLSHTHSGPEFPLITDLLSAAVAQYITRFEVAADTARERTAKVRAAIATASTEIANT